MLIFFIVDAPIQCASFYVDRIDLTSKLRKIWTKWQWNRPFSVKKSPHKFSNTDPSNLIISWLTHFKQTFSLKNWKTTYSTTQKTFSLHFKFHLILKQLPLNTFFTVFQISPYFEGSTRKFSPQNWLKIIIPRDNVSQFYNFFVNVISLQHHF